MNANQYRARLAEGIPPGNLTAVNMLTLKGINGGVNVSARGLQNRTNYDQARAAYAVGLNLATSPGYTFPASKNPYSRLLGRKYYNAGLGDDSTDFDPVSAGAAFTPDYSAPMVEPDAQINQGAQLQTYAVSSTPILSPQPTAGSSSDWMSVLNSSSAKSVFSGLGTGLANLISGNKSPSLLPVSPTSAMPSLGTMLLLGAGVLGVGYVIFRKRKTA